MNDPWSHCLRGLDSVRSSRFRVPGSVLRVDTVPAIRTLDTSNSVPGGFDCRVDDERLQSAPHSACHSAQSGRVKPCQAWSGSVRPCQAMSGSRLLRPPKAAPESCQVRLLTCAAVSEGPHSSPSSAGPCLQSSNPVQPSPTESNPVRAYLKHSSHKTYSNLANPRNLKEDSILGYVIFLLSFAGPID